MRSPRASDASGPIAHAGQAVLDRAAETARAAVQLLDIRTLSEKERTSLLEQARAGSRYVWTRRHDLAYARNAHATNSPGQMRAALASDSNFLEGDVRVDSRGRIVMAHGPAQLNGMTFAEWAAIAAVSGRGIKVDVKEPEAIVPMLRELRKHGVSGRRLIFNVPVAGNKQGKDASLGDLRLIRSNYPNAVINLSHQRYPYTDDDVRQLSTLAKFVGGRVMFPVRADTLDEELVDALSPHGVVAAWNEPWLHSPKSIHQERRKLRGLGVDGMIDVRKRPKVRPEVSLPKVSVHEISVPNVSVPSRLGRWFHQVAQRAGLD